MKKIELLAPAGNMTCLKMAVAAGCDAVYLAGKSFGARGYAGNFSNEEIIEAIEYAHLYGVRVYITVNTLIYEAEVNNFMKYIGFLCQNNVDALIIQDIGMLDLIHQTYPSLELHISTQMHIHNLEGVLLLKSLGAKRVVLARETPLQEVKRIIDESKMDIEIFGHGALCFAYSGQCLMSSFIGSRSANRGLCAGSCRLSYDIVSNEKVISQEKYNLSCKDLKTLENIGNIIKSQVSSLKIEGRMKRSEYVYEVVSIYREVIDNYYNNIYTDYESLNKRLKLIYSRDFTEGYLLNENPQLINSYRPNHLGIEVGQIENVKKDYIEIKLSDSVSINDGLRIINENEDVGLILNNFYINKKLVKVASHGQVIRIKKNFNVRVNDKVVKTSDSLQLERINRDAMTLKRKVKLTAVTTLINGQKAILEVTDGTNKINVMTDELITTALTREVTSEDIKRQLRKLEDTPYNLDSLEITKDDNIFISLKELNNLRRKAIAELNKKRLVKYNYQKKDYKREVCDYLPDRKINCLIDSYLLYQEVSKYNFNNIIVTNEKLLNINDERIVLKLPRVMKSYKNHQNKLLVGELGSVYKYPNTFSDFSLNVTNSYSVALLHSLGVLKVTLSYELSKTQIKDIITSYLKRYHKKPNLEVIVYGKREVMISKYNLYNKYKANSLYLRDKFNNKYQAVDGDYYMQLYDYHIFQSNEDFFEIGVNHLRYNFETLTDIKNICTQIKY